MGQVQNEEHLSLIAVIGVERPNKASVEQGFNGERRSEDSGARSVRGRQPERMLRVIAETTERVDVFRTRRVRTCLSLSSDPSLHEPTLSASFLPYELCYSDQIVLAHWRALPVKRDLMNAIFCIFQWGTDAVASPGLESIAGGTRCTPPPHLRRALVWPWDRRSKVQKKWWCWSQKFVVVPVMVMGKQELVGVCSQAPGMGRGYSCCLLCGPIFCYGSRAHTEVKYKKGCLFEE